MQKLIQAVLIIWFCAVGSFANAATGEMGTGTPDFGVYSAAPSWSPTRTLIWSLSNVQIGFPAGCSYVILDLTTMGIDSYKIALSIMMQARATNTRVRFYAHTSLNGGCGVDYVQPTP